MLTVVPVPLGVLSPPRAATLAAPQLLLADESHPDFLIALLEVSNPLLISRGHLPISPPILCHPALTGSALVPPSPQAITLSLQYTHQSNYALLHALLLNDALLRTLPDMMLPRGEPAADGANRGFVPTEAWLTGWKARMPLTAIYAMLDALLPRTTAEQLLHGLPDALKAVSLTAVVPTPTGVVVRRYAPNEHSRTWLTQVTWGLVYSRNQELFDARSVRLVQILQVEEN